MGQDQALVTIMDVVRDWLDKPNAGALEAVDALNEIALILGEAGYHVEGDPDEDAGPKGGTSWR